MEPKLGPRAWLRAVPTTDPPTPSSAALSSDAPDAVVSDPDA
jgi:hypothetical protein